MLYNIISQYVIFDYFWLDSYDTTLTRRIVLIITLELMFGLRREGLYLCAWVYIVGFAIAYTVILCPYKLSSYARHCHQPQFFGFDLDNNVNNNNNNGNNKKKWINWFAVIVNNLLSSFSINLWSSIKLLGHMFYYFQVCLSHIMRRSSAL